MLLVLGAELRNRQISRPLEKRLPPIAVSCLD
jgi:hypothetical protein